MTGLYWSRRPGKWQAVITLGQIDRTDDVPRMRDTLDVLLLGATDKEIAAELGISPHTVRQYVKAILRAYGVSGRGQLIARHEAS